MPDKGISVSDRREATRRICLLSVLMHRKEKIKKVTAISFSRSGCFFQSEIVPEMGEKILFEFPPKGSRMTPIYIIGEVSRVCTTPDPVLQLAGFAVKWVTLYSPGGWNEIRNFIIQIFTSLPAGKEWKLVETAKLINPPQLLGAEVPGQSAFSKRHTGRNKTPTSKHKVITGKEKRATGKEKIITGRQKVFQQETVKPQQKDSGAFSYKPPEKFAKEVIELEPAATQKEKISGQFKATDQFRREVIGVQSEKSPAQQKKEIPGSPYTKPTEQLKKDVFKRAAELKSSVQEPPPASKETSATILKDAFAVSIPLRFWVNLELFEGVAYKLSPLGLLIYADKPPHIGKTIEISFRAVMPLEEDEIKVTGIVFASEAETFGHEFVVKIFKIEGTFRKDAFDRYIKWLKER
jgi:hypothetical protein